MTERVDERQPQVPVRCPDCESTARVPLPEVANAVDRHNRQLHDGRDVAAVDPDLVDELADVVAEDLGLL